MSRGWSDADVLAMAELEMRDVWKFYEPFFLLSDERDRFRQVLYKYLREGR